MGKVELEAALRRDGEKKAREIWEIVEKEAKQLRSELREELQREDDDARERLTDEIATQAKLKQLAAEQQAHKQRLEAELVLASRLRTLAEQQLSELAVAGGEPLFYALADEIPDHHWAYVQVNSRDLPLAQKRYPRAAVEVNDGIDGGLVVRDKDDLVQIENTLSKRLHHIWPELLPELMDELRHDIEEHDAAE